MEETLQDGIIWISYVFVRGKWFGEIKANSPKLKKWLVSRSFLIPNALRDLPNQAVMFNQTNDAAFRWHVKKILLGLAAINRDSGSIQIKSRCADNQHFPFAYKAEIRLQPKREKIPRPKLQDPD